jgi:hypothetical protein
MERRLTGVLVLGQGASCAERDECLAQDVIVPPDDGFCTAPRAGLPGTLEVIAGQCVE